MFVKMIELALEMDKPIVVHSRKAEKECLEMLEHSRGEESYYALLFRKVKSGKAHYCK